MSRNNLDKLIEEKLFLLIFSIKIQIRKSTFNSFPVQIAKKSYVIAKIYIIFYSFIMFVTVIALNN